jgi:hypothetical protein
MMTRNPAVTISKVLILLIVGTLLGATGCKKKEQPAVVSAGSVEQAPASPAYEATLTTQASRASGAAASPETVDLNREVRKWILRNRRPPRNFEDFAATSDVQIPPPPAGKKYVLDKTMHVTVANR